MKYVTYSFRHGEAIMKEPQYNPIYSEIIQIIEGITEQNLQDKHNSYLPNAPMSLSKAINNLLKEKFIEKGWREESPIFQDTQYEGDKWRLDFAKIPISVEVAFNHGEATAWNLLKPVLASELNHVQKAIQTEIGVIITATSNLKAAGAFDSAVGTYEKFLDYLVPLSSVLSVPLVLIGLEAPETFRVVKDNSSGRNVGSIQLLA